MRYPDWRARLEAYFRQVGREPFAWGRHDCALFLAGAVEAMTGEDYAAPFRGRYKTPLGAQRVLRKEGFESLAAVASAHLKEIPPAAARVGDGALVRVEGIEALGVVQGPRVRVLTENYAGLVSRAFITRAFEV